MRTAERFTVAVLIAAGLSATPAAAQQPPRVEVTFRIQAESQLAKTKMPGDQVRLAHAQISNLLAGYCWTYFGFVRWQQVLPDQPVTRGVPRLTLVLYDEQLRGGKQIYLRFNKTMGGLETPMQLGPFVLIEWSQPTRPATSLALERLVAAKLASVTMFAGESFRRALHTGFLRTIPLSRQVFPDDTARQVVIPLAWETLLADRGSIFEVRFLTERPAAGRMRGTMLLTRISKREDPEHQGMVQGGIKEFDCPPLRLPKEPDPNPAVPRDWDPEVQQLLARGVVREVEVVMDDYVRVPGREPSGALIVSPH